MSFFYIFGRMSRQKQPHHIAWLEAHPHRTERWLRDRLRDGFDVHHIDGDKENNDPRNLILIEHTDHMALHNGGTIHIGRLKPFGGRPEKTKRERRAEEAYEREKERIRQAALEYIETQGDIVQAVRDDQEWDRFLSGE